MILSASKNTGKIHLAPFLLRCKARKRYPGIHASLIIDKEVKRAVRFYRSQKKRQGQVDDFKNVLDVITHSVPMALMANCTLRGPQCRSDDKHQKTS